METFTQLETAWTVLLGICASIGVVGGAILLISKLYQWQRKPIKDTEETLNDIKKYLANDKRRIEILEKQQYEASKQNKLMLRGLVTLLEHEIDGNHVEHLVNVRDEIQDYLIERSNREIGDLK